MRTLKQHGFSLVELLVVLTILGLLASVVGPRVTKYMGDSKSKTAKMQIADLGAGLDLFLLDTGRYPNSEEGLASLVKAENIQNWNGPYLKKSTIPLDPWGRPFEYKFPGEHAEFDLVSLGADGQPGGDGENQDITSWN